MMMNPSHSESDRRSFQRVSWECHARLLPLSLDRSERMLGMHHVLGRNISEGGLQVWTDRLFAVRAQLLMEMDAPEIPEGIQAVGSVVWVSPTTSEEQWLVGIEFSDVGDSARTRIRGLVHAESALFD